MSDPLAYVEIARLKREMRDLRVAFAAALHQGGGAVEISRDSWMHILDNWDHLRLAARDHDGVRTFFLDYSGYGVVGGVERDGVDDDVPKS